MAPKKKKVQPKSSFHSQQKISGIPQHKDRGRYHHGDLRQAIIASAVHLIDTKGSANFSLREIAASISVTHAAVYRHFSNKREILAAVAEEGFKKMIHSLTLSQTAETAEIGDTIYKQFKNYVYFALDNPGHFKAMFHQDLSEKKDIPDLEKISSEAGNLLMHSARLLLKSAHNSPLSLESIALAFWSMMHGFAELALSRQFPTARANDPDLMEQRIREITQLFLGGFVHTNPKNLKKNQPSKVLVKKPTG